jgi:5-methylthioribose kinase
MMKLSLDLDHGLLSQYLQQKNWLEQGEKVSSTEKPGEGNMNLVLRVKSDQGKSLILKQANAFVQKYPSIPAPIERIVVEAKFYQLVAKWPDLAALLPSFIGFDPEDHIMALQDLGAGTDFTNIYQKGQNISQDSLMDAIAFLSILHNLDPLEADHSSFPDNLALRKLNYEHLFHYPYLVDSGFDLDTVQVGLQAAALPFRQDEELKKQLLELGAIYLSSGPQLLHGDFYPGSWLHTANGFKVIDPEFCYWGRAEYDLGVLLAHLKMAQVSEDLFDHALLAYRQPVGFDETLVPQFAGMEILRRIIGLAQLPLDLSLEERKALLSLATQMVKTKTFVA